MVQARDGLSLDQDGGSGHGKKSDGLRYIWK